MENENTTPPEAAEEAPQEVSETKHEPHQHARPRLLIGIAAVVVVAVIGLVWSRWGETIKEVCFGEDGACPVELPDAPVDGDTPLFETTTFNDLEEGDEPVADTVVAEETVPEPDLPPLPAAPFEDIPDEVQ